MNVDSDGRVGGNVGEVDVVLGVVEGEGVLEKGDVSRECLGGHLGPGGRDGSHGSEGGALLHKSAQTKSRLGHRDSWVVLLVGWVVGEWQLALDLVLGIVLEVGVVVGREGDLRFCTGSRQHGEKKQPKKS